MSIKLNGFPFDSQITGYGADGLPEYDRASNSEEFASLLHGFWRDGIFGTSALVVLAESGLTATVGAGSILIQGRVARATTAKTITFDTASSQPRFDRVVARLDLSNAVRDIVLDVVKGTPASSPVAPSLTRNQSVWELCLATVRIPAGATVVQQSNITDTRLDNNLCGIVAATMIDVDTSHFYDQVQGDLSDFRVNEQARLSAFFDQKQKDFNAWFDELQSALDGDVAANLTAQLQRKASAYKEIVTLSSGGWTKSDSEYTQRVSCSIASAGESDAYVVSPAPDSINAYAQSFVYAAEVGVGYLVFRAKTAPDEDLAVNVLEVEKGTAS